MRISKEAYRKKLQDPRWQKKRLAILERDQFRCVLCHDTETTLHIHHKRYSDGDPWEIDDSALVTLCASCHEYESESLGAAIADLRDAVKDRYCVEQIEMLTETVRRCIPIDGYGRSSEAQSRDPVGYLADQIAARRFEH